MMCKNGTLLISFTQEKVGCEITTTEDKQHLTNHSLWCLGMVLFSVRLKWSQCMLFWHNWEQDHFRAHSLSTLPLIWKSDKHRGSTWRRKPTTTKKGKKRKKRKKEQQQQKNKCRKQSLKSVFIVQRISSTTQWLHWD